MRRFHFIPLVFAAGCLAGCEPRNQPAAEPPSAQTIPVTTEAPITAESAAILRFREQLGPEILARHNACPFECCVYGDWVADTVIPMYPAPQTRGAPAFELAKGTRMKADSGIVFITSIAYAVVDDTVFRYADRRAWLLPNDTLVLLNPIGEGFWAMWRRGEVLPEVPPFFENIPEPKRGHLVGTPSREWWVHAVANGRAGWFPADSVRVRGADACGGPI